MSGIGRMSIADDPHFATDRNAELIKECRERGSREPVASSCAKNLKSKEPLLRVLHSLVERSRGRTGQDLRHSENEAACLAESVSAGCGRQMK